MRHQAAPPTTRQLTSPLLVTVLYEIEHDDRVTSDEEEEMAPPLCIHIHPLPLPSTTNHTPAPVIVMRTSQATAGRVVSHKSDTRIQLIHATLKHSKPTHKPRTYSNNLQKQHRKARLVESRTVKQSSMSSVSTMMTTRHIASGDGDGDDEGQDQDHGHDDRGQCAMSNQFHAPSPKPRAKRHSEKIY